MGQPSGPNIHYIVKMSERRELKHLSTGRKREQQVYSPSSGERTGKSPNLQVYGPEGVIGSILGQERGEQKQMEVCGREGDTPVCEAKRRPMDT